MNIEVYGAEVLCPSCVNMPSSKETQEWLSAALLRKYPDQAIEVSYIDIYNPDLEGAKKDMAEKVRNDEYFYPLVVINGNVVGEGSPRLKTICEELEKLGFVKGA
ncbi:YuzD family protein [Metabacillus sp. KIGAM252]|uniref:YuzD family protein n=1 Tax=Metabacillus flavus TaxID=2823519 RepID=A0ABS5LIU1_9BACI|nr:YuzD family protein [Metabacillus flavus]MBS2970398.1 YuzD family protein [Metabacillus flavus]